MKDYRNLGWADENKDTVMKLGHRCENVTIGALVRLAIHGSPIKKVPHILRNLKHGIFNYKLLLINSLYDPSNLSAEDIIDDVYEVCNYRRRLRYAELLTIHNLFLHHLLL